MPTITANMKDVGELIGRAVKADELEGLLRLAKAELKETDAARVRSGSS